MKIDSHQHFWKYDPIRDSWIDDSMETIRRDFFPDDLEDLLEQNGIDGCVAVQADQSEKETEFLLHLANENNFIKGVVGWVDLCASNVSERLGHFSKNPYFKGVRHILQAENNDFMLQKSFQHGIEQLKQFDLSYDILVFPNQLKNSIALVERFPEQRFVLDHLGKPNIKDGEMDNWRADIEALAKHPNVYCKLSGMVTEADWNNWKPHDIYPYIEKIINAFGTDRIMYGSDWPVCLLAGKYDEVFGIVKEYIRQLTKDEQNNILGGAAASFYKLSA
ncbi:amidohydrolase family protein [Flagellimonas eckloniae]|uniref:Amidohydrolase n=1 Tax=Flagellimonas eckloniae TaxID=346185 RepID=A0A0Q1H795_9FLAO|nr:amidohydrolase family protein [Allomuricauda eckloniae]KQC29561.1 amidohydrolase [Allomuricauda eckloniae]